MSIGCGLHAADHQVRTSWRSRRTRLERGLPPARQPTWTKGAHQDRRTCCAGTDVYATPLANNRLPLIRLLSRGERGRGACTHDSSHNSRARTRTDRRCRARPRAVRTKPCWSPLSGSSRRTCSPRAYADCHSFTDASSSSRAATSCGATAGFIPGRSPIAIRQTCTIHPRLLVTAAAPPAAARSRCVGSAPCPPRCPSPSRRGRASRRRRRR